MSVAEALPAAEPVEGYVWCDKEGAIHDDVPNPYDVPCERGPNQYHHPMLCVEDQSGDHYVCPGPHKALYVLEEVT